MPTPAQLAANVELLALALSTLHLTVDHSTAATLEHGAVDLNSINRAWMATIYKTVHPDTALRAKYKALLKSTKGTHWETLAPTNLPKTKTGMSK